MLTILTSDYDYFEEYAEKTCAKVLPQKINNDRDLYRIYAKSAKDVPTVINVDIEITFLEALSKFSVNFTLDDFMVLNVAKSNFSPFRYIILFFDQLFITVTIHKIISQTLIYFVCL